MTKRKERRGDTEKRGRKARRKGGKEENWHKGITIRRLATDQLAVSPYNSQHPQKLSPSHVRDLVGTKTV